MVAVAALSTIARLIDVPYPILLVLGGLVLGLIPGLPDVTRPGPRPDHLPAAAALRGGVLLLAARPSRASSADHDARDRPGAGDRRGVALVAHCVDRRHALGGRIRPRRDRRPHRPDRRERDHPPAGSAAPTGDDHRGREPDQRRHRAGHLPRRGRGRGRRQLLAWSGGLDFVLAVVGGVADRPRRRLGDRRGPRAGSRTRRSRSRSRSPPRTRPTCRPSRSASLASSPPSPAGIYLGWKAPEIASPSQRIQGRPVWETAQSSSSTRSCSSSSGCSCRSSSGARGDLRARPGRLCGGDLRHGCRSAPLWLEHRPRIRSELLDRRHGNWLAGSVWRMRTVGGWAGMRGRSRSPRRWRFPANRCRRAVPAARPDHLPTFSVILFTLRGRGPDAALADPPPRRRRRRAPRRSKRRYRPAPRRRSPPERLEELAGRRLDPRRHGERVRRQFEYRRRRFAPPRRRRSRPASRSARSPTSVWCASFDAQRQARGRAPQQRRDLQRGDVANRARARPRGLTARDVVARFALYPRRRQPTAPCGGR